MTRKFMQNHFDHRLDSYMRFLNRKGIFLIIVILGAYLFYNHLDVFHEVPQILKISELGYSEEVVTKKLCYKNSLGTGIYELEIEGEELNSSNSILISVAFNEFNNESDSIKSLLENLNKTTKNDDQIIQINWENVDLYFNKLDPNIWNSNLAYSENSLTEVAKDNTLFLQKNNRLLIIKINGFFEFNRTNIDVLSKLIDLDYSFTK